MRLISLNWSMVCLSVKTYDSVGRAAGKGHARLLREIERKARRCGDGDEMSDAECRTFLYQLETSAAGHGGETGIPVHALPRHRAQQLVERIVTADILAHELNLACRRHPGSCMDGVIDPVHRLARRQVAEGFPHSGRI